MEKSNDALTKYNSFLKNKQEYLKIEEVEEIQQKTIQDMKILNEEIYSYFDSHLSKHLLNSEKST